MIKTIFMGTPDFALETLKYVDSNTELLSIFTKEDKFNARGNKIIYSPVKTYAIEHNIECIQPKSLRTEEIYNYIKKLNPDLIVVAAYGKIIPEEIINIPRLGIINVHSSLLPKYRGASPIHSALYNLDEKTGISIMMIDKGLDTGDVLEQEEIEIEESDNLGTLTDKLSKLAVIPLKRAIDKLVEGKETRTKQDDSKAIIVKPISKEEMKIDWNKTTNEIFGLVRSLSPSVGAYSILNGERVKIYEVERINQKFDTVAKVVELSKKGPIVSTKDGAVILKLVKFEGKKTQNGIDIINGRKIVKGDEFSNE